MSVTQSISTYQSIINDATALLYDVSDSPRIDAEVLLQHVIEKPLAWLIAHGDSLATKAHLLAFFELIALRQQGQPIAYITGHKEFWSLDLKVNESVLIPRPDTEILVEQALERLAKDKPNAVLDLGTGSGAIALAIAKERPLSSVVAIDSQAPAIEIAKQNAEANKVNNASFLLSAWFSDLPSQKFDLIASNPPYIEPNDHHLEKGDLRFEPSSALIGADDGLGDIRHIIANAPEYLVTGGHILIEHGYNQKTQVRDILLTKGFCDVNNYQDLNNLPRCTAAKWPST